MRLKALLVVFGLSQMTCHQVILTAPPGSVMNCERNPEQIPAVGGVSVISCVVFESIGTPVADGTVVQFFTTLGRIPEQGRTNDGVVRVNLEATGRSGDAVVTAFSGGEGGGGGGGGSTTTTTTLSAQRTISASGGQVSAGLSALAARDDVTVRIGVPTAQDILIVANPRRLTDSRSSQITANVFDSSGNPIGGIPVFFRVESGTVVVPAPTPTTTATATATPIPSGATGPESLDSQGQPVFTDTNGQARDVLRTRWPRDAGVRTVTVFAQLPDGRSDSVVITIN